MKDISVIIPVYNAEPSLPRCLDSILGGAPEAMEILLINDGSTDGSAGICERYATDDPRVVFLTQENQGAVAARNRGMDMARGTYLLFVDADDYVSPGYLRGLYTTALATAADIVFCNLQRLRGKTVVEATSYTQETRVRLSERLALLAETYYPGPYAKIYRKSLLEDNGIRFLSKEGYFGFAEDMLFALHSSHAAREIAFCPTAWYYYCLDNENSICSNPSIQLRNNNDRLIIIDHMLCFSREKQLKGEELLPILHAVENHLRWGGRHTLKTFLSSLDVSNVLPEVKDHFHRFAEEWKQSEGLFQCFKADLKEKFRRRPMLYKCALALKSFLRSSRYQ